MMLPAEAQSGSGMSGVAIGQAGPAVQVSPLQGSGAVRISGGVMASLLIEKVDPVYPPIALAAHVGGTVVLHALISKEGKVTNLQAVSGPNMLMGAAIDAVRHWAYKPYLLNGEPVDVDTTVVVSFDLKSASASSPTRASQQGIQQLVEEGPPPPPAPAPPGSLVISGATGPARLSGGVMAGRIVSKVIPVYPVEAKKARVEGTVIMHAIIGTDGAIEDLTVISGPDMLRDAATDAVRRWTYQPYLLNGEPTSVDTTITVNFKLAEPLPPFPDAAPN